jgi:uncharacterized repeat protein (TIGR03803 family)
MQKQDWRAARSVSIAALLLITLTGCGGGGSQPTSPPLQYTVGGTVTGLATGASLVLSNEGADSIIGRDGSFYGTTKGGGANGGGTLFKLTLDGTLSVVWAFGAGTDGAEAWTGVTQGIDGNFYGTTIGGGTIKTCGSEYDYGCGTVFRVTPDGQEIVLWDFGFGGNGTQPFPLGVAQNADGSLFGVNWIGGPAGGGTIYQLTQ